MITALRKRPKEYALKEPSDVYKILNDLNKQKANEKLKFVVNELCSNVFENRETAKIIFSDKLIHLIIDGKTLDEEKKYAIKISIMLAKALKMTGGIIKMNKEDCGGLGMKMIYGSGYEMDYKDNGETFSIVAFSR